MKQVEFRGGLMRLRFTLPVLLCLASVSPLSLRAQDSTTTKLDGGNAGWIIAEHGTAQILRFDGPEFKETRWASRDRNDLPRHAVQWYMIHDSTMGVIFRKPSGVKYDDGEYDFDLHIKALETIFGVEIRILAFNVWNDPANSFSYSRVILMEQLARTSFDPRNYVTDKYFRDHFTSIVWVSRVRLPDGTIREADTEAVLAAARIVSGADIEQLEEELLKQPVELRRQTALLGGQDTNNTRAK